MYANYATLSASYREPKDVASMIKYGKKYYAHDEANQAHVGDTVTIMETRPLSALKRFRLVSIDKLAVETVEVKEVEVEETTTEEVKEAE